jgi:hypothetical protein
MDAVRKEIEELVQKELDSANSMFPLFHSAIEGYAVILEEMQETGEALEKSNMYLESLWFQIRKNISGHVTNTMADGIKLYAIKTATEAVQVAAMAQKYLDSMEVRNGQD